MNLLDVQTLNGKEIFDYGIKVIELCLIPYFRLWYKTINALKDDVNSIKNALFDNYERKGLVSEAQNMKAKVDELYIYHKITNRGLIDLQVRKTDVIEPPA